MVIVNKQKTRGNSLELKVLITAQTFAGGNYLAIFKNNFNNHLKYIKSGNSYNAEFTYKLFETENELKLELWKITMRGDKKRLVAIIEDNQVPAPDPFANLFK